MNILQTLCVSTAPLLGLVALAGNALQAQQPAPLALATAMQSCGLRAFGDTCLGAGPDYEVRFDRNGIEYLPMLGKAAPRHLPLRFTFDSARRGETVLPTDTNVAPVPDGMTVRYERNGIVERYDLRHDGVEQSFVVAARPNGAGDLRVRGHLATELSAAVNADGGVDFVLPGVGGVRYGKVTGVDARGNTVPGSMTLSGNLLELVLPASFVVTAAYPIVLDPLLGTDFQIAFGTSSDDGEPDVAYDVTNDVYLVAWKRSASTAGTAIRAQRLNADGTLAGSLILLSGSGASGAKLLPRVANCNQRDRFLVAWQDSASIFGPFGIQCRAVSAVDGTLSAIVPITTAASDQSSLCCSSDSTGTDDEVMLAWRTATSEIVAALVTLPAAGTDPLPAAPVVITGTALASAPCLSKSGGASGRHVIAWQELHVTPTQTEIHVRAVTRDLGLIGNELVITNNLVNDALPAVDGDGSTFALVWSQAPNDIRGRMLSVNASVLTLLSGEFPIEADAADNETNPDIAYLGAGKWCVVWNELGDSFAADVFGTILVADGTRCGVEMAFPGVDRTPQHVRESLPRVVGKFAGSSTVGSDEGLVVFGEAQNLPPFEGDVIGQRIEAIGQGGLVTSVSSTCGLGGTAAVNGPCALGNSQFAFTLSSADPAAPLCLLSLNLQTALFPCGPCALLPPLVLETHPLVGGSASRALAMPCDAGLVGTVLMAQWLPMFGTTAPCPLFNFLSASNVLQVLIGP